MFLNEWVFRQNLKNFKWSQQEDELLKQIMDDFKYFFIRNMFLRCLLRKMPGLEKIKWIEVSKKFNKSAKIISQKRSSHQCKERWENTLKKKFKKLILLFIIKKKYCLIEETGKLRRI